MNCKYCGRDSPNEPYCTTRCSDNAKSDSYVGRSVVWIVAALLVVAILTWATPAEAIHEDVAIQGSFGMHTMILCDTELQMKSLVLELQTNGEDRANELLNAMVDNDGNLLCRGTEAVIAITSVLLEMGEGEETMYIVQVIVIGSAMRFPPFVRFFFEPIVRFGFTSSPVVTYEEYKEHLENPVEEMEADGI